MVKGPLSDRLEYAILEIVFRQTKADHQNYWGGWETEVRALVPDYSDTQDLLAAFKRLWTGGVLRLTKPDNAGRHAHDYSGNNADDDIFFFTGGFNAVLTPAGRSYWDGIRVQKKSASIGFPQA
jgi:hypothetical protein